MPKTSPYRTRGGRTVKITSSSDDSTSAAAATIPATKPRASSRRATIAGSSSSSSSSAAAAKKTSTTTTTTTTITSTSSSASSKSSNKPSSNKSSNTTSKWSIFFYLPNLIGYLRVVATLYSLYLGVQQDAKWEAVVGLYFLAFALDAVDGHVARTVGQESGFGGVLDMVTDRTATAGLVMINLLVEEEDWKKFGWICLCMLDIASHWFHCIAAAGRHHKSAEATAGKNFILRWYYACKPLFFACCIGQELFYLLNFIKEKGETMGRVAAPVWMHPEMKGYFPIDILESLWWVTMVLGGIKQVVNVAQLASAAVNLAEEDAEKRNLTKKGRNGGELGGREGGKDCVAGECETGPFER